MFPFTVPEPVVCPPTLALLPPVVAPLPPVIVYVPEYIPTPDPAWMAHLQRRVRQRARYLQQRKHTRQLQDFLATPTRIRVTQPMVTVTACTVCVQDESVLNRVL